MGEKDENTLAELCKKATDRKEEEEENTQDTSMHTKQDCQMLNLRHEQIYISLHYLVYITLDVYVCVCFSMHGYV